MPDEPTPQTEAWQLDVSGLDELHNVLKSDGYQVIGPRVTGDAIVLGELESASELPFGWGVTLSPGGYRLRQRADTAAFAHSAGPQSWKQFLHPPRERLWSGRREGDGFAPDPAPPPPPKMAFVGVRPCDLRAIQIQDQILGAPSHPDSAYAARRAGIFIVAVNCTEPGEACFCTSMGTGPAAGPGYDLLLTELAGSDQHSFDDHSFDDHSFIVETGSPAGAAVLARLPVRSAEPAALSNARAAVADAAGQMGRTMEASGLRDLLAGSHGAARWDDVASRCLTCGNCTMACPTCFCTTVEDVTDLSGEHAERWQSWASCYGLDFSYLHGGPVRSSSVSRYRQWLTHKLGTWHDQFGSSGCVGCGRCIVWCPVGIDLTEEVAALRAEADGAAADQGERA